MLIFINWATWIYAVGTEKIIDASFGYFIMPILSVFLGYIFYDEKINQKSKCTKKIRNKESNDLTIRKITEDVFS